ncbi:MAG: ABC transporter ATP-binding protein, partial [Candidatus Brocadiales bacterium]
MLRIKDVSIRAGDFHLHNICLSVLDYQCHIVCGPTGSGKTLLLESIMGLRKIYKGRILLNDKDIERLPPDKRGIAYLPQDLALFPHMDVKGNIFFSLKMKKVRDKAHINLVYDLVDVTRIGHLLNRPVNTLSGGERQRVALVRALASGCKLLLLDEPFSALHEAMRKELWFLIKELQKKYKLTIVMVTHDLEEAFFLGDVISILINGRICQTSPKKDAYYRPETMETAQFLGIKNLFNAEIIDVKNDALVVHCKDLNVNLNVQVNG